MSLLKNVLRDISFLQWTKTDFSARRRGDVTCVQSFINEYLAVVIQPHRHISIYIDIYEKYIFIYILWNKLFRNPPLSSSGFLWSDSFHIKLSKRIYSGVFAPLMVVNMNIGRYCTKQDIEGEGGLGVFGNILQTQRYYISIVIGHFLPMSALNILMISIRREDQWIIRKPPCSHGLLHCPHCIFSCSFIPGDSSPAGVYLERVISYSGQERSPYFSPCGGNDAVQIPLVSRPHIWHLLYEKDGSFQHPQGCCTDGVKWWMLGTDLHSCQSRWLMLRLLMSTAGECKYVVFHKASPWWQGQELRDQLP